MILAHNIVNHIIGQFSFKELSAEIFVLCKTGGNGRKAARTTRKHDASINCC